jgi:hypothetical protein
MTPSLASGPPRAVPTPEYSVVIPVFNEQAWRRCSIA